MTFTDIFRKTIAGTEIEMLNSLSNKIALASFLGAVWMPIPLGAASQDSPLLVGGTETIFQRVITRPFAPLFEQPQRGDAVEEFPPFQPLYVFERLESGWVRVGTSPTKGSIGWMDQESVIEWKQNIVASFANPANRKRQILFKTSEKLEKFLNHESVPSVQAQLINDSREGRRNPEWEVVAVEPENYIDIRTKFYLMPILRYIEGIDHPINYEPLLLMEVASVPLDLQPPTRSKPGEFTAGVVFVIDTTQSMDPYIRSTRQAVEKIVTGIGESDIGTMVHFGAIGFRDNPDVAPGVVYRTKLLAALDRNSEPDQIVRALAGAGAAERPTVGFNEDSLAGISEAIEVIDWDQDGKPFGGKYVILITDAGPKSPQDGHALLDIGSSELQSIAEEAGIAILTLHLKTNEGEGNHRYAEREYRKLSKFEGETYYYPIDGGSEAAFNREVTNIVSALVGHVGTKSGEDQVRQEADKSLVELGHAMRMRFLGDIEETVAPDVISGWISDRAAEKPDAIALTPRLLITKNELSTITKTLQEILEFAEEGQQTGQTSFRKLRDGISRLAVNPDLVVNANFDTLGGAVAEFIDRLPYTSQLMGMTEDRWANAGDERREIIDSLRSKISAFRKLHDDPKNWTSLYEGAPDGESVTAMKFELLP